LKKLFIYGFFTQNKMLPFVVVLLTIGYLTTNAEKILPDDAKLAGKIRKNDGNSKQGAKWLPEDYILESLSVLRSQATAANIYLQEIRSTFKSYEERFDQIEERLDKMNDRLDSVEGKMKVSLEKTEVVKEHVLANREATTTIKDRQNVMLSEVRLISLYKMTDQTGSYKPYGGHGSDLVVDGQFVFGNWDPKSTTRAFYHSDFLPNQWISIDLGGLFRIHRIKIWQSRHAPLDKYGDRVIGIRVLVGDKLVGITATKEYIQDFKVGKNDPTYGKSVTLNQPAKNWFHVLEVQVWGTGPFADNDKFA